MLLGYFQVHPYLYPRFEKVGAGVYWFASVRPSVRPLFGKIFRQRFLTTMQARMLIFGMQVDDDLLYRGIENQPSTAYSSLICPICFHSIL